MYTQDFLLFKFFNIVILNSIKTIEFNSLRTYESSLLTVKLKTFVARSSCIKYIIENFCKIKNKSYWVLLPYVLIYLVSYFCPRWIRHDILCV